MGPSEVDLAMRLKVLSKIRDYAGNDFYQSWASSLEAMDIIRDWLKTAVTSKTGDWDETVMPLLHVSFRPVCMFILCLELFYLYVIRNAEAETVRSGDRQATLDPRIFKECKDWEGDYQVERVIVKFR